MRGRDCVYEQVVPRTTPPPTTTTRNHRSNRIRSDQTLICNVLLLKKYLIVQASEQDLVEDILNEVEKMIKDSLSEFEFGSMRTFVEAAVQHVKNAGSSRDYWKRMDAYITDAHAQIFTKCKGNTPNACDTWQNSRQSGAALILEIQFADLLIANAITTAEHCLEDTFKNIVNNQLELASKVITAHVGVFRTYRLKQLKKGETKKCSNTRVCTDPCKDEEEDEDFCKQFNKDKQCTKYTCREVKATRIQRVDNCFQKYSDEVSLEIDQLEYRAEQVANVTSKLLEVKSIAC